MKTVLLRTATFIAALVAACLDMPEPTTNEAPPEVVGLRPATGVALEAPVAILLSEEVMLASDRWPVVLATDDGRGIGADVALAAGGREIVLAPVERWPAGARVTVTLELGFVGANGRPLAAGAGDLVFETAPEPEAEPSLTVRMPAPARAAPLNLRLLAVSGAGLAEAPEELLLVAGDGGQRVSAQVERRTADGVLLARLPEHRGVCQPLCPATRYRVAVEGGAALAAAGPRGEVLTATVADLEPPVITSTAIRHRGDRVVLEVNAREPILLSGSLRRSDGEAVALEAPAVADVSVFLEPGWPLEPEAEYTFEVQVEDVAGNAGPALSIAARMKPRIDVMITEVVPAPAHDWGDSDGLGVPFDDRPGFGTVSDTDEWVELVNLSDVAIDLVESGLVLRVIDTSPAETPLEGAPQLYFGDGGTRARWWPGEALVVRPRGSIAQRGFILELASGERIIDRIEVGDVPGAVMRSGTPPDLEHESLARDASGRFRWCLPTPGDPLPNPSCS